MQGCPEVDLLIRTSGEHRLSDFLLWQSSYAQLVFSDTLWPDYSFWNLLQALVQYQRSYPDLEKLRAANQQATASMSHCLEDSMTVRQSSSRSPRGSQCKACSPLAVSADTRQAVCCGESGKAAAEKEAIDVDTSDSSASSESGAASPHESPARVARSSIPPQQHDKGCIHSGEQSCQSCSIAQNVGQQSDIACTLSNTPSSSPAVEPLVLQDSKVLTRTLHAGVDCGTISLPSLNRRLPYRPLKDLSC